MTTRLIQQRLRQLRGKTRTKLLGTLAGPCAVACFSVLGNKQFAPLEELPKLLFVFAFAWSLAGLYFLNRSMWSTAMPSEAGLSTGLEFCRKELLRQRDLLRRLLLWSFGPTLLSIATYLVALAMKGSMARRLYPNAVPFLILIAVWIAAYLVIRFRDQRALDREIAEWDEMAGDSIGSQGS